MTALAPIPLVAPVPEGIPMLLRQARRWAPWRAVWNATKGKYEKIPHRAARPEYGLSNKGQAGWCSFEEAWTAYRANIDGPPLLNREGERIVFGGVGYLMTGPHGVSGIDLDHCVKDGVIDPWAHEIAAKFDSYTELSPSGTGLHIMIAETVPSDWMNHEVQPGPLGRMMGIEVYGGHEGRFLCVTGARVDGSRAEMQPLRMAALETVEKRHRKARTKAEVEDLRLPDLIPPELMRDISTMELSHQASNFLYDGPGPGDRSNQLYAASVALAAAGLDGDELLSVLEANEHAMEIALDHRHQDYDKALRYLWKEHCQKAVAKAKKEREDLAGTFDALPAEEKAEADNRHCDLSPVKPIRFQPIPPDQFMLRKPMQWLVRDLLPRAGLAVIYGASGSGKTFLTLDIVASISRGVEWRGKRVSAGRGVYVVAEGADGFRSRIHAYCEFHGVDPASLAVGVIPDVPNLMHSADTDLLIAGIKTYGKIDYVVVDTYARVMVGGNENDAKDTGTMVAHCARIHKETDAMVILVHHSGKNTDSGARGSSVLRAAADVEIEVTSPLQGKGVRTARVSKMKDGDDSGKFGFELHIVELGVTEDGDPITSCVIKHREGAADAEEALPAAKGHIEKAVLSTIQSLQDLDGRPSYNNAIEAIVSQIPHDQSKRDRRRELVVRAIEKLEASGALVLERGEVGLK